MTKYISPLCAQKHAGEKEVSEKTLKKWWLIIHEDWECLFREVEREIRATCLKILQCHYNIETRQGGGGYRGNCLAA